MKPTTRDVLHRLRLAGSRGIHSFEFRDPERGRVHLDAPKRISELRELGFFIASEPEVVSGSRGRRYTLIGEPDTSDLGAAPGRQGDGDSPPRQSRRAEIGGPVAPPASHGSPEKHSPAVAGALFGEEVGRVSPRHDQVEEAV